MRVHSLLMKRLRVTLLNRVRQYLPRKQLVGASEAAQVDQYECASLRLSVRVPVQACASSLHFSCVNFVASSQHVRY